MRFSLRTLLLSILTIAAFLGLYRWIWPHYPNGYLAVLAGDPRASAPFLSSRAPSWSVVRFDDRVVGVNTDPDRVSTVLHSPFPIVKHDTRVTNLPNLPKDFWQIPFGLHGKRADGSVGLLTIAPTDLRVPHVVTPYGPAMQIVYARRLTGSSLGIEIATSENAFRWTDCLTVTSDGGAGVVVRVAARVPAKVERTVLILPLHSSKPVLQRRFIGQIESDWESHFEELPDGLWYIWGRIDDLPKKTVDIFAKPICFKKETTPQGSKVTEYR